MNKRLYRYFFFFLLLTGLTSFHSTRVADEYVIVIDKHKYELSVFDRQGWLVTYPCVFGSKNLGDKMMEGDRKTPEGTYHIISKKRSPKWHCFLMLDYPTAADKQKFDQRKAAGQIPARARIGNGIGIHGTWPHEDYTIDQYQSWTDGCIAMRNNEVDELYNMIPIGTTVYIR